MFKYQMLDTCIRLRVLATRCKSNEQRSSVRFFALLKFLLLEMRTRVLQPPIPIHLLHALVAKPKKM